MDMDYATDEEVKELVGRINFAAPPPAKRGPVRVNPYKVFWIQVRQMLMENPGRWALVMPDTNMNTVYRIKRGRNPQIDPETFEVTTRSIKGSAARHVALYLRYVGENGEFEDVGDA